MTIIITPTMDNQLLRDNFLGCMKELSGLIEKNKTEMDSLKHRNRKLEEGMGVLQKANDSQLVKTKTIQLLQVQHGRKIDECIEKESRIAELEAELDKTKRELSEMKLLVKKTDEEANRANTREKCIDTELSRLRIENERLTKMNAFLERKNQSMTESIGKTVEREKAIETEISRQRIENERLTKRVDATEAELKSKINETDLLKRKLAFLEASSKTEESKIGANSAIGSITLLFCIIIHVAPRLITKKEIIDLIVKTGGEKIPDYRCKQEHLNALIKHLGKKKADQNTINMLIGKIDIISSKCNIEKVINGVDIRPKKRIDDSEAPSEDSDDSEAVEESDTSDED